MDMRPLFSDDLGGSPVAGTSVRRCCICASTDDVKPCNWCRHYFCRAHRDGWEVWERGLAALKWWLFAHPPEHCAH